MANNLRRRIHDSYSVFVGHIHPDVTRRELGDVFKACGEVVDVVILVSESNSYNFGFVRYIESDAAFRAVKELNRWPLGGCELVVDISKDTANKIKEEKGQGSQARPEVSRRQRSGRDDGIPGNSSLFLQDTMYLNRLRENCASLHLKASDGTGKIGAEFLMEDIGQADVVRFPTVWGSLSNPAVSFPLISHKIMQRCRSSAEAETDPCFGEKKAVEFLSSLETIMKEIGSVLGTRYDTSAEEVDNNSKEELDQKLGNDDLAVKQCLDEIRSDKSSPGDEPTEKTNTESKSDHSDSGDEEDFQRVPGREYTAVGQDEDSDENCEMTESCKQAKASELKSKCDIGRESVNRDQMRDSAVDASHYGTHNFETSDGGKMSDEKEFLEKAICKEMYLDRSNSAERTGGDSLTKYVGVNVNVHSGKPVCYESSVSEQQNDNSDSDVEANQTQSGTSAVDDLYTSKDSSLDEVPPSKAEFLDPAILDFHLPEHNESKQTPRSVLDELFANMTVHGEKTGSYSEMVRSVSKDSDVSSGSNEGNVDDSGVESDYFSCRPVRTEPQLQRFVVDRTAVRERPRAPCYGRAGRRSCPETSVSQRSSVDTSFDLQSYVASIGRGQSMLPGFDRPTKAAVGRGIFSLK